MVDVFLRDFYWRQCRTMGGRGAAQCRQPQTPGVRCKIQKENHKYRMGWGLREVNKLFWAGAGPAHRLTLTPIIFKGTDCKNL